MTQRHRRRRARKTILTLTCCPRGAHARLERQRGFFEIATVVAASKEYRSSGTKTLETFEMSHEFREAEEGFYRLHKQEFQAATKKRRKAIMATATDQDLAASKLQAILRGRKTRKKEMDRAREIRRKEIEKREANRAEAKKTHDNKLRLLEDKMKLFNNTNGLKKLQALQRGRSIRRRSAVAEKRVMLKAEQECSVEM